MEANDHFLTHEQLRSQAIWVELHVIIWTLSLPAQLQSSKTLGFSRFAHLVISKAPNCRLEDCWQVSTSKDI